MKNKLVNGVGINDADYKVHKYMRVAGVRKIAWMCPFYKVWRNMIMRCYSLPYQAACPTYIDCYVSDSWKRFSNFKAWMETQDWQEKCLDKDILVRGNKVYSSDTCVFISSELNKFLTDRAAARGDYPVGVSFNKPISKYTANCCNPFTMKKEHLGVFTDPLVAHEAWRAKKHDLALQYAEMQSDPRVAEVLKLRYLYDEV